MDDELQRLSRLLNIARDKIHNLEREREELDRGRAEKFSEYLEMENLFKKNGEVLETAREEADIQKSIDSLLGP